MGLYRWLRDRRRARQLVSLQLRSGQAARGSRRIRSSARHGCRAEIRPSAHSDAPPERDSAMLRDRRVFDDEGFARRLALLRIGRLRWPKRPIATPMMIIGCIAGVVTVILVHPILLLMRARSTAAWLGGLALVSGCASTTRQHVARPPVPNGRKSSRPRAIACSQRYRIRVLSHSRRGGTRRSTHALAGASPRAEARAVGRRDLVRGQEAGGCARTGSRSHSA